MDFILSILQDAFFGGLAGIGFASISNPPKNAYKYCFVISAVGHAIRFVLMNNSYYHFGLIVASFVAALSIGFLTVFMARKAKCPPETFSFPSLLPMIPGMYAYRTIEGLVMCLFTIICIFAHRMALPVHSTSLEWYWGQLCLSLS